MIKRILIALDPDKDTPAATQHGLLLAKRFDASLTGLAVVDTSNFYPAAITGEPDKTHHARNLWEELNEETRQEAQNLLQKFESAVKEAGVRYSAIRKEGASYERIIEGLKYHDLLIAGRDSHFFYNEPEKETGTLAKVIKHGIAPALVVPPGKYSEVTRVLVAFDGSSPAARSLKSFVHLAPYGRDIEVDLLYVETGKEKTTHEEAKDILGYAESYLSEHHFSRIIKTVISSGRPGSSILERQKESGAGLIVLGAHSVSAIRRLAFGSTTYDLLKKCETPLFLSP